MSRTCLTSALLTAAVLAATSPTPAQTYTWQGGAASNNWGLGGNWYGGGAPPVTGSADLTFIDQYFSNGAAYIYPNLDANYSVHSVTIAGTSSFTLTGNTGCALLIGAGGLTQNTIENQTIDFPIGLGASQTWTLSGGSNLSVLGGIDANSQPLTISTTGASTFSAVFAGTAGLTTTGTGALTLSGAGSTLGAMSVTQGSTTVNGGSLTLTATDSTLLAVGEGAAATLTISGGAVVTAIATGAGGSNLIDGPAGTTVIVTGSGSKLNAAGYLLVGYGRTGTLTVQNGGTVTNASPQYLQVGTIAGSNGALLVNSGGTVSVVNGDIGVFPGSTGSATVTGAGSAWTVSGQLVLGEGNGAAGGTGQLTVADGGAVTASQLAIGTSVSSIAVNGGTLTTGRLIVDSGAVPTISLSDPAGGGAALTVGTQNSSSTYAGAIVDSTGGPGTVSKVGTGTQTFTGVLTNTGGYTATAGTVDFSGALVQPGPGSLTVAAGATIQYDTGARVFGGFLRGPGAHVVTGATFTGVTAFSDAVINVTGSGSFVNFTNGATMSVTGGIASPIVFNGFSNEGSGSITVGARSSINAAEFQSYGALTLTPAPALLAPTLITNTGTTPLYFNGGSRTFLGTPATAIMNGLPTFDAGINLNGQNAVVAGGLLVNNGFVADGSAAGTATIIADFGSLVKGAGFFQNPVITQNGGKFQAGNSPGSATFGSFVFGPGGVNNYVFAIDDATGTAGPHPNAAGQVSGWGLVSVVQQQTGSIATPGNFTWTADPADKLTIALDTLVNPTVVGTDVAGPMADFDPSQPYSWPAVTWTGTYSGPIDTATLDADTAFDTSGFLNPINGTFAWSLSGSSLSLSYTPTPVPEPGTLALVGLAAAGLAGWRRRGQSNSHTDSGAP